MNLLQLRTTARMLADDSTANSLWTDDELTVYINEAEREAARRARLILDPDTADDGASPTPAPLCVVPLLAGATTIPLHRKIIFVRSVRLDSRELPLPRAHIRDMDATFPTWPTDPAGEPLVYIPNWKHRVLRLYPATELADTARLQVVRLPLADMAADLDEPEIDEQYHMTMLNWALHRMFLKPDEDTQDKVKAADYLAMFEQEFGQRSSAIEETWIQREHGYDDHEGVF